MARLHGPSVDDGTAPSAPLVLVNCPECGKAAIFCRGREAECLNGHIWQTPADNSYDHDGYPIRVR